MISQEALEAAVDEMVELAEPQPSLAKRWAEQSGDHALTRRRGTVVLDSATGQPVELARLSRSEWDDRVTAKALAKQLGEQYGR